MNSKFATAAVSQIPKHKQYNKIILVHLLSFSILYPVIFQLCSHECCDLYDNNGSSFHRVSIAPERS